MIDPFSNPSYLLSPLIVGVISCILLVTVLLKARRSLSTSMFCCFLLSAALISFLLFGMRSSPDVDHALPWERAVAVVSGAAFAFYYHFTLTYANTSARIKRHILYAAYSFVVVLVLLAPTDLLVEGMRLEDYGYAPIVGPLSFALGAMVLFLAGVGAHNLFGKYRTASSYEERNRVVYLLIAIIFPVLGLLLDAFSNLPPASMWSNLLFSIVCTIAIVKYHLLDIRVVIRRSLAYLLVSVTIAVPYVSMLLLLNQILMARIEPWWAHALIILLLAIVLRPLYSRTQASVDRAFYRDRYDYLRALERFSRQAQSITDIGELSSTVIYLVRGALRTSSAYLLLSSGARGGLVVVASSGLESPPSEVVLRNRSPLVRWLDLRGDILSSEQLDIVPQLQGLSAKEKHKLVQMGAKLYVPIKSRRGHLSGILALGERLSQQPYSGEDRQLLTALSNQMGIALQNAWLYEESQQAEKELRQREKEYRELAESITDVFFAMNEELRYTYWNKASEQLTGIAAKDAIGKHLYDLFPDTEATRRAEEAYLKVLRAKQPQYFISEYLIKGKHFEFEISAYPSEGGLSVFVKDVTEQKQAEEREKRLQQELNLSSRLVAIGELAAGVAHEINNPLTGIMGFSQRLLRKGTDQASKRDLERVYEEACRAAKVVENLQTFARRREPKEEWVNINDVLQKAVEMRLYELKTSNIEVATDLAPSLPLIKADFQQIQQVFLNIIMNAEQAMIEANNEGKLSIKTREKNGYTIIMFTDDGPGIQNENLHKLFDPFFTTRGEKGGTGLGLSICHGIVTEHGGKIYARSKLGKGTTFFVELPMTTEEIDEDKVLEQEPIQRSK